jgi:hypothetical protein
MLCLMCGNFYVVFGNWCCLCCVWCCPCSLCVVCAMFYGCSVYVVFGAWCVCGVSCYVLSPYQCRLHIQTGSALTKILILFSLHVSFSLLLFLPPSVCLPLSISLCLFISRRPSIPSTYAPHNLGIHPYTHLLLCYAPGCSCPSSGVGRHGGPQWLLTLLWGKNNGLSASSGKFER